MRLLLVRILFGFTLRDYFAAQAMQAAFAHALRLDLNDNPNVAKAAYEVADRMLQERAK